MATKKTPAVKPVRKKPDGTVDEFFLQLDHPLKGALQNVRAAILGASPEITEGIKWNAPSFRVSEFFATASIRNNEVMVILHQGAKTRESSVTGIDITDTDGILEWLAKDRCAVKFRDLNDVKSKQKAFQNIVRQWIALM